MHKQSIQGERRASTAVLLAVAGACVVGGIEVARAVPIYAVNTDNNLLSFDSATPQTPTSGVFISGLQPGESVQAIDFRPATGQLYALGSTSRLYTLNTVTGAATPVGGVFSTPLSGTAFGFDFNPVVDRIRVVSDTDQNFRLDPTTGALIGPDTNLAYAAGDPNAGANPNVVGVAYDRNFASSTTTTLYGIDTNGATFDRLVRIGSPDGTPLSPNSGQVFTVGSLGVNVSNLLGFDIRGTGVGEPDGVAYAAMQQLPGGVSQLYTINLTTGLASLVGTITGGEFIRDISVADFAVPEPGSAFIAVAGVALAVTSRRRS
jgi:hypothetical protein